ncbi:DUF6506 family protein [Aeromonas enteropelogenes]|uniref:DUF6506 family protein n=1 Tax=Aeromonas enteropelogenes TaxID=29489 RepID=UPI003B9E5CB5
MSNIFKAAFIFVAPAANPTLNTSWVKTEKVHVKMLAVPNYQCGCELLEEWTDPAPVDDPALNSCSE